jgi:SPP1 gp7 family putative phage head morphogenesis protein
MKIKELFKKDDGATMNAKALKEQTQKNYSVANRIDLTDETKKTLKEKNFNVSDLGANVFKTTIFKSELRTPHYEMQKSLENYEEIPHINSGVNQIVNFIVGNGVKISSTDHYTNEWYKAWKAQRPDLYQKIYEIVLMGEVCGNAYIEPTWDKTTDGIEYMNDFKNVQDPSRVYYNLTQNITPDEYYIYQVPYIFRKYGDMNIKLFRITYVKNGIAWQETVYGVPLKKDDLIHFKVGWSRYGFYGRSYLASTINDTEILTQLLKNYAIMARYMAMGKKVFSVLPDDGETIPLDELDNITNILNTPEDEEHIVINRKLNVNDMAPTQVNEFSGPLEFVRKDMTSGVLPNFMTPWADSVTFASSNNAKVPFELSLENKRLRYIDMLNKNILEHVRKQNPKLKDATFEFGEVTLDNSAEIMSGMLQLYNSDLITMNQMLKKADLPVVQNGDIYKSQRNYLIQEKYQLSQSGVEQYQEPYMQRTIQNDMEKKNEEDAETGQNTQVATREQTPEEVEKTKRARDERDEPEDEIKVRDKTNDIDKELKESVSNTEQQFIAGDTYVDKLSKDLFKSVKELQWEVTQEILDEIKQTAIKSEKYSRKFKEKNIVHPDVVNKIDNLYYSFNDKLKNKVDEIIEKLAKEDIQIEIIDDMPGTTRPARLSPETIYAKDMLKNIIFDQFNTFNATQSQTIKRILTDGIIARTPVGVLEQELKDAVIDWKKVRPSDADYKISRITNTELHKAAIQFKLLEWKNMGVKKVVYRTHEDDRVRPEHRANHNKVFTIDEALRLKTWREINCRCDFLPAL